MKPAGGADTELIRLPFRRRRIADASSRDVDVLLAQRVDDVAGGQLPRGETHRIEPDAHRVLALAEDDDVGDAGHTLQRILDVDVQVVG